MPNRRYAMEAGADRRRYRRPLVLVAETCDDSRAMLRTLLTLNGFDVAECADGQSTLEQADRLSPDVVLLDDYLPRLDAWTVARTLRASQDTSRIVFMSCRDGRDQELAARWCGSDRYLVKPIDLDELLRLVKRLSGQDDAPAQ